MLDTAIRFKRPSLKYIAVIDHVDSIPVNCVHRKDIKPQQSDCNHYNIHIILHNIRNETSNIYNYALLPVITRRLYHIVCNIIIECETIV